VKGAPEAAGQAALAAAVAWTPCTCGGARAVIRGLPVHTRPDGTWEAHAHGRGDGEEAARAGAVAFVADVVAGRAP
jgi:hypothetical protein